MPSSYRNDIVLVRYPFSDLSSSKVRPAVVINGAHPSQDIIIVPLTSRTMGLLPGEFVLADWHAAGLNVVSAIKRGVFTLHESLVVKVVGRLTSSDAASLEQSLHMWLELT